MSMVRRRRGRPRRDEPREINDFDLALIREFQQRPAFYDRTHPQYRNRDFLEPQWLEISRSLGYNVAMVKNRMIQLRNRYNLEKRRVETMQEQYNDPNISSQWVLYEHLSFLSDHIKSRRSFAKQVLPLQPKRPPSNSSDSDDGDDSQQFDNDIATESETPLQPPEPSHSNTAANHGGALQLNNPMNGVDKFNSYPYEAANNDIGNENGLVGGSGSASVDKFKAFGNFLASSLIEMNEKDALCLVEKFTSDLVHSLLSEQNTKPLQQQRPSGDQSTSLSNISI